MSKPEVTFDQAVEKRDQIKNDLRTARKEVVAFRKENSIKKDEKPKDAKIAAKLEKLEASVTGLEEKLEKAIAKVKELKPASARAFKYEYPMVKDEKTGKDREMTAQEKKKFRAKSRAEKKKAEKGEAEPKKDKKTKEEPAPKVKKEKKNKPEPEETDED